MCTWSAPIRNQRGVALVMALLVLLVISILSATLMLTLNVETKIAGHSVREAQALNVAEAGVGEALSHIRSGSIPVNNNPRQVAQIFLTSSGSVPVLGVDSIALPTGQPAGQWLRYSTATKSADVLTVQYKTDAARTVIYRYDESKNPPVQTLSGLPIFVVSATGWKGEDVRRITTEVIQKPINAMVNSAFTANQDIEFSGTSHVCGYNHSINTPPYTTNRPGDGTGCEPWELGYGDLPASWTSGTITSAGAATQTSPSVPPNKQTQSGFYAGPWEPLGMSQAEFFSWVGPPVSTEPNPPNGIYYLDNNNTTQDMSGNFAYHGGNGEGLLYIDGDCTINGDFTFKGVVYVEGDIKINGTAWILGALVANGRTNIKIANGTLTVLYSRDAVAQSLAKFGGQFVTLSWRER